MKKVLGLNIYFKLSDDFEGGLNEALEEYIKYRKENNLLRVPEYIKEKVHNIDMWDQFYNDVQEGNNVSGNFTLSELNDKNEWEEI